MKILRILNKHITVSIMTKRAGTALETDACNAFYKDDGRRPWALVAFMVEHEEQVVEPDGTMLPRQRESNGGAFFRASELCEHMIPLRAGFGGYHHPRAPSNNRAQLLKEMAKDAEREGWISREQDRHGGIYKYALTEGGRNVYREMIAPQRDAFVENYLKTREAGVRQTIVPTGEVPKRHRQGGGDTDKEDRIGRLQKRYKRGDSGSERHRAAGGRRGRN
jgi:hypothetical protein